MIDCKEECRWAERCDAARGFRYKRESCPVFERKVTMTNGDRIRAMTDEELADKISAMIHMDCLNCVVLQNDCIAWENSSVDCKAAWLDWLKQEAEE